MTGVDVILCCYNQENYIDKAIDGLLSQNIPNWLNVNVIVADDSSSDKTAEIIKDRLVNSNLDFFFLGRERNYGVLQNYRRAFKACRCEYVAILEGDDWWCSHNHLANHISFLEKHLSYSMSVNSFKIFNEAKGALIEPSWPFPKEFKRYNTKDLIVFGNQIGNLSACVFRRKYLAEISDDYFSEHLSDWEISILLSKRGPVAKLKESTSVYRILEKSVSHGEATREQVIKCLCDSLDTMNRRLSFKYDKYFETGKYNLRNDVQYPVPMSFKSRIKHILACLKLQ